MIDMKNYGYPETLSTTDGLLSGRVTELRRERFTVMTELGEVTAVLKGTFYHQAGSRADFPCVGDFVRLHHNEKGDSRIVEVLPRRTTFKRADYSGHAVGYVKTIREQVVATNFDYVFILSSLNHDFNVSRIMRYVTQAGQSGAQAIVVLTKTDLFSDHASALAEVRSAIPDVPAYAVSSHTTQGLNELRCYLLPGKTIVFLGMSGVGKSSLLNALTGTNSMNVNAVRDSDSRGRHTTTHRQLFMLPGGAMIIDTPGMRELGLFDSDAGIQTNFADIRRRIGQCRFADCCHRTEPGCAIRSALDEGSLSRDRWQRYLTQQQENDFVHHKKSSTRSKESKKTKNRLGK